LYRVGYAYLDLELTGEKAHLWIVCAEPYSDPDERVIVSVVTDLPHIRDRSCELKPGDHEFIKRDSLVFFQKSKVVTVNDLNAWTKRGNLVVKPVASPALISRIRGAAILSLYTPRHVKSAIQDCEWTPPKAAALAD
jgi:hypothetical protein